MYHFEPYFDSPERTVLTVIHPPLPAPSQDSGSARPPADAECYLAPPPDSPEANAPYDWPDEDDEEPPDECAVPEGWLRGPAVLLGEPVAATAEDLTGRGFREGGLADGLQPGPALGVLTAAAAANPDMLTDNELLGAASAARRLQAHAEWLQLRQVAAFARLNEARFEASKSRAEKRRFHEGEFGAEELAFQLNVTRQAARTMMDLARNLDDRLHHVFAGMHDGRIDAVKAWHIHHFTAPLSDDKAAIADKILAEAAPDLSENSVYAKARRVCYKLDPELFDALREETARKHQRVEVAQEDSGNARVSMRELGVADAAAIKASLDAEAARLKDAGLDAPLRQIRAWIIRDRALGLDPWERLIPAGQPPPDNGPGDTGEPPVAPSDADANVSDSPSDGDGAPDGDGSPDGPSDGDGSLDGDASGRRGKASLPALINIVTTDASLFGWSPTLGQAGAWGLLSPDQIRDLIEAGSRHPRTRWCVTLVDPESREAIAHGCARGRHPWTPPQAEDLPKPGSTHDGPSPSQRAQLYDLLRKLDVTLEPIARGTCDHRHAEDQYIPSRKLKHLMHARTTTCPARGCGAQASHNETDHTDPWPRGKTDECNISPPCGRHHHAKHAPQWKLEQVAPGVLKWTTPSGRTFTTRPTRYDT